MLKVIPETVVARYSRFYIYNITRRVHAEGYSRNGEGYIYNILLEAYLLKVIPETVRVH